MTKEAYEVKDGSVIDYTLTGDTAVGTVVPLTNIIGVAMVSGLTGETIGLAIDGVYEIAAADADAVAVGDVLYFDATNRVLTTTTTGNARAGIAVSAKPANTPGAVQVKLNVG
jgi:predicted RecA/RadA family phage recombinase